eukprot:6456998-Amphidinium_carterae.2
MQPGVRIREGPSRCCLRCIGFGVPRVLKQDVQHWRKLCRDRGEVPVGAGSSFLTAPTGTVCYLAWLPAVCPERGDEHVQWPMPVGLLLTFCMLSLSGLSGVRADKLKSASMWTIWSGCCRTWNENQTKTLEGLACRPFPFCEDHH